MSSKRFESERRARNVGRRRKDDDEVQNELDALKEGGDFDEKRDAASRPGHYTEE
jgi:hypothetical protein